MQAKSGGFGPIRRKENRTAGNIRLIEDGRKENRVKTGGRGDNYLRNCIREGRAVVEGRGRGEGQPGRWSHAWTDPIWGAKGVECFRKATANAEVIIPRKPSGARKAHGKRSHRPSRILKTRWDRGGRLMDWCIFKKNKIKLKK